MFPQKLKDLLEGVGYKCLQGDDQVLVNDVVYDSRRVRPGCVFVCLIGSAVDSHQYAAQAVEAGAAAVVASRRLELAKERWCWWRTPARRWPICRRRCSAIRR